jgi:Tol biopolymer transport system component
LSWAPNGKQIALGDAVVDVGTGERRAVLKASVPIGSRAVGSVSWSPDGRRIAYAAGFTRRILIANSRGGKPRRLPNAITLNVDRSPGGKRIAYTSPGGLKIMNVRTGRIRTLVRAASVAPRHLTALVWSPNGRRIAYMVADGNDNGQISVVDTDGSRQRTVAIRRLPEHRRADPYSIDWQPVLMRNKRG